MKYCTECLYPNTHPLGITFNNDGLCSGCIIHKEKFEIDWIKKQNELKILLNEYKNVSQNNWDCVIPVSGGRDSFFIVDLIKNKYKMNPLLVTYNKHYNSHTGNRNIAYLKTIFDCDHITLTIDPRIIKKLTQYTLKYFGSIYWHCIAGEIVFPVRIAVNFKIPLIIWGVHQGVDQVGMFSHHDMVEMNRRYRLEHDMMGFVADDIINNQSNLNENDLSPFIYPHDNEIEAIGVKGIFLSNYIPWDTKKQHELMIQKYDYKTLNLERTIDTYNDVDSLIYTDLHDYIKYVKHGYGKITDHLTREIRWKRISRNKAIDVLHEYSLDNKPNFLSEFLEWLDMNENTFFKIIESFRNDVLWEKISDKKFKLKTPIEKHYEKDILQKEKIKFLDNELDYSYKENYILLERGYGNSI